MNEQENIKLYRPSNGTEGDWFHSKFCDNCLKDKEYREHQRNGCDIICFTMALDVTDKDYPSEWRYVNGEPVCTAFVPDTPEEVAKKKFFAKRDKNTPDLFS